MLTQLLTANGNTAAFNFFGGSGTLFATGTFGGGNVKLQASLDGLTNWFDCTDPTGTVLNITANGILNFDIAPSMLRGVLSGAAAGGTAQVETATCAGTVTVGGIATLTLTHPLVAGSPRVISFAVAAGDTPTLWAIKARAALADDVEFGKYFTIGGATTALVVTTSAQVRAANVAGAAFNLAINTGTATGITAAPTSADTTAGVASAAAVTIRIAERASN